MFRRYEYEISKELGSGKFGLVKSGINKETKKPVAIKIMAKKNMDKSYPSPDIKKKEIQAIKLPVYFDL